MRALCFDNLGSPDVLEIREIARPAPKDNQVLVKVHAVSINDWDWGLFQDHPFTRVGAMLPFPKVTLGCDIAGRVEAVGSKVTRFKPGDAVFGDLSRYVGGFGGFAEYACANENQLALKPERMTYEQAAAIPQAGVLIVQAIAAGGPVKAGKRILINGAGGGCGTMGIQILKMHDVEVTGVDNEGKLDLMRSLGFHHVIDYRQEDFTRNGKLYDLIIDTKTSRPPSDIARALAPGGTYATVGGNAQLLPFGMMKSYLRWRYKKNMRLIGLKANSELPYLCKLFEDGKLTPIVDQPYQFTEEDVRAAFRRFGAGEQRGKIVVTVASP